MEFCIASKTLLAHNYSREPHGTIKTVPPGFGLEITTGAVGGEGRWQCSQAHKAHTLKANKLCL